MDKKFVYLFTEKKEDTVKKAVYNEWQRCLDQFNMEVALMEHDGWQVVVNAMYDDETFIKVAKFTKGSEIVRLRIENVEVFD